IAYCDGAGIVAGYGDGTFGPDDILTGYAWEKMLLCALGYDGDYESMTGVNWTIGVATLAKKLDLEKGLSTVSMNNSVSRDVAAKLAYNTMLGSVVTFHSNISTVTSGDVSVSINSGAYYTNYDGTDVDAYDGSNIFEVYWNATVTKGETDDFGRPSTTYFIDELNFELTVAEDPVAVVSARTNSATMASLLSGYKLYIREYVDTNNDGITDAYSNTSSLVSINNSTKYNASSLLYSGGYVTQYDSNGDAYTAFTAGTSVAWIGTSNSTDTVASALQDLTANGKVVEFYANGRSNSQVITDVVTIEYTVGKVTKASTSGTVTTYSVRSIDENTSATNYIVDSSDSSADTAFVASDVVKDDIVTYVVSRYNDHLYIYPTTSVEGYLSAYSTTNNANSVTLDGNRYSVAMGVSGGSKGLLGTAASNSAAFNATAAAAKYDCFTAVNKDVTLYLDQYGYAVYTDGTGASDFIYVLARDQGSNVLDQTAYDVGIIDQEGTMSIVYAQDGNQPTPNQWYTMSADGSYKTFNDAKTTGNYAEADGTLYNSNLSSSQATIISGVTVTGSDNGTTFTVSGNVVANSSMVFIVKSNGSYKVYNGISNLATYNNLSGTTAQTVVELEKDDNGNWDMGYAVAVYVDAGDTSATSSNDEVIYLLKSGATNYTSRGYDENGTQYYTYDAIVDGVKTTISTSTTLSDDATTGYAPGLYTYNTDSDGYISGLNAVSIYSSTNQTAEYNRDLYIGAGEVISYSSPVLQINGESYTLSDDAVVYYIHGNSNTVEVGDASLLVGTVSMSATLYVVYTSASNHTITEVYFDTNGVINEN
ncbi:MAG: S-layer homology domain-containing protein, partial [Oscillospiraceae bacterium]|nr:S-layer homology domain-containing protein [Oscillospiraceae bacterium]